MQGNQHASNFSELSIELVHCLKEDENAAEGCRSREEAEDWWQNLDQAFQIILTIDYEQIQMKNISYPIQDMKKLLVFEVDL